MKSNIPLQFIATDPTLIPAAIAVVRRLHDAGFVAYFAGGSVRDAILGRAVKDIDIATSAVPDAVEALFQGRTLSIGKSFGVILVKESGQTFDVATFRQDGGYQDGRHPTDITFAGDECDAQRRDITINGLFYDPLTEQVIDYVGGIEDLKQGVIRAIGDPTRRFQEDRLRMLRAIRFTAVTGFQLDEATYQAIQTQAAAITQVSQERISSELIRTLCEAQDPQYALELLYQTTLLQHILPELIPLRHCEQNPIYHPEGNVWQHTTIMLQLVPAPRAPALVWAILLHDIGKPQCFIPDGMRTPGHAAVSAKMATPILRRFKQANALIDDVTTAVYYHMQFTELPKMKPATVRRMLARPTIQLELALHRVDCLSSHAKLDLYDLAQAKLAQFKDEPILPEPFITGHDLIAHGIKPGKAMGAILKRVYAAQLNGDITTREEAVHWATAPSEDCEQPWQVLPAW